MKKKPVIGLTCNLYYDIFKEFTDAFRYSLYEDNAIAISNAGGIPVILPVLSKKQEITSLLNIIDGLMLVGGNAPISPSLYTSNRLANKLANKVPGTLPKKFPSTLPKKNLSPILRHDIYNLALIHGSIKQNIPLLGICRGFEIINIALGGSLCECYTSAQKKINKTKKIKNIHNPNTKQNHIAHNLKIAKNTTLKKIVGATHMSMNSFHTQCVDILSADLQANAHSEDGIVEGFEWHDNLKNKRPFILGLQGHPEMLAVKGNLTPKKQAKKIFSHFIQTVLATTKT